MRKSGIVALLLLVTFVLSSCSDPVDHSEAPIPDDYEVYSAYLEQSVKFNEFSPVLLICSNTISDDAGEAFIEKVPKRFHPGELDHSLIRALAETASSSSELSNDFKLSFRYQLVSSDQLKALTDDLEPGFRREKAVSDAFPNSTLPFFLSKIGYSEDGSKALFFVTRMGIDGRYVLMRKELGKWNVDIERWSYIV
ncbi:MAG: hypothetical protein IPM21_09105 [Acidobacteria bacterium]|nr:hypothetical protein [Acidobacteriota bacterium]